MKRITFTGVAGLVVGTVALAGCSGHEGHSSKGEPMDHSAMPMAPSPTVAGATEIVMTGTTPNFAPKDFTVKAGQPFTITLTASDAEHDLSVSGAAGHVHALAGQTVSGGFQIDQPGTYTFRCDQPGHADAGMTGTITVV